MQEVEDAVAQDELATLKARADVLGLTYHPSIGLEKLRAKVAAAMSDEPQPDDAAPATSVAEPFPQPEVETEGQRLKRLKLEALALVRISLTCMNPAKKDWDGEIIGAGNSLIGFIKKYIPFNSTEGWHVPRILLNVLLDRKYQHFSTRRTRAGVDARESKLMREFAIEILPPLTPQELKDLAQRQAMAAGGSE